LQELTVGFFPALLYKKRRTQPTQLVRCQRAEPFASMPVPWQHPSAARPPARHALPAQTSQRAAMRPRPAAASAVRGGLGEAVPDQRGGGGAVQEAAAARDRGPAGRAGARAAFRPGAPRALSRVQACQFGRRALSTTRLCNCTFPPFCRCPADAPRAAPPAPPVAKPQALDAARPSALADLNRALDRQLASFGIHPARPGLRDEELLAAMKLLE
jgi:hypothetical protein